jgi:hypothetical protein
MFSHSVANPQHFDGDPDPCFQSDADPDPVTHQSDKICDHWSLIPPRLLFETLPLSPRGGVPIPIVSVRPSTSPF